MSRICDVCKKPIPHGTNNIIELKFRGRLADKIRKFHGVDNFDFCSFTCFGKFMPRKRGDKNE